jgi:hypothetical protein
MPNDDRSSKLPDDFPYVTRPPTKFEHANVGPGVRQSILLAQNMSSLKVGERL